MGSSDKRPPPAARPPNELIAAPVATAAHRSAPPARLALASPRPDAHDTHIQLGWPFPGRARGRAQGGRLAW